MERKASHSPKLPVVSQTTKENHFTKSEPAEKEVVEDSSMTKTENAFKGLSIASKRKENLEYNFPKQNNAPFRSLEDVLAENKNLKEQLDLTKQSWDIDKRVLEGKVKSLEEKVKDVLEKGVRSLEQELDDSVRVSNVEIEAHNYEKLYKAAKEELRLSRPLLEVGAAVRHHYLEKSQKKLATWYGTQALFTTNVPVRDACLAADNDPNAKADLALYQCGFLDPNNREQAKKFVELYKTDVNVAMQHFLLQSRSQVELCNLRGALFTTTKSRLGGDIAFFNPHPYIEAFLRLDQEITFLCPKMVEEGKPLYQDGGEPVEDPRVWEKLGKVKRVLGVLGVSEEHNNRHSR